MATATQIKSFIEEIAPCAQYAYTQLGKVKPSVCIGMACVESAYGTSKIMRNHNAFFGQKVGTGKTATKYWSGNFFTTQTSEEYTVGTHTIIQAAFRSYTDMSQCCCNFYELLNTSLYAKVKADADYQTQMAQIKACGYMTSSTEVNSVIKLIQLYDLTKYDVICNITDCNDNPYPVPQRTLKRTCKGDDVKWLQTELIKRGYDVGSVDGIFGQKTYSAVCLFQKYSTENLTVDGVVGTYTRNALQKLD